MTSPTQVDVESLVLPPGCVLVRNDDGTTEIVKRPGRSVVRTIGFRVDPAMELELYDFFDAFPNARAATAMRWLLSQPEVKAVMQRKIAQSYERNPE